MESSLPSSVDRFLSAVSTAPWFQKDQARNGKPKFHQPLWIGVESLLNCAWNVANTRLKYPFGWLFFYPGVSNCGKPIAFTPKCLSKISFALSDEMFIISTTLHNSNLLSFIIIRLCGFFRSLLESSSHLCTFSQLVRPLLNVTNSSISRACRRRKISKNCNSNFNLLRFPF